MNFIDISSHQQGISLPGLFDANPALDGVIVKVSQGTGYVNPFAKEWLDWLTANGKPVGTYHYLDMMGAEAEARHYVESVRPWLGRAVLAIDYEESTLAKGTAYLKACLDEVYRLTGIRPLVYCSRSVTQAQNFNDIARTGYRLWMAQYADMATVNGFVDNPWHSGSVAPFNGYVMQQYTSCGRLNGWDKNLDFDKFFGNLDDWQALYDGEQPAPEPPAELKPADPTVVADVLAGRYGIGNERYKALTAAGYDPDSVQKKINELYVVAAKVKPIVADNMDYLNSIIKIVRM